MKRPRWDGAFEIRKRYSLPGCDVRVKVVPPEEAERLDLCLGQWIYDHNKQTAVILLDGRLPIEVQRATLLHEVVHAAHDIDDQMNEKDPEHVQKFVAWFARQLALTPDWCPGPRIAEDA